MIDQTINVVFRVLIDRDWPGVSPASRKVQANT